MIDYRLYLVTDDPARYRTNDWIGHVIAAVEGGVTCVQYRDTESAPGELLARAKRLGGALKARRIPLVVNNDVALAAAIGADGVHVGQSDMPAAEAAALLAGRLGAVTGAPVEIGLSITAAAQLASVPPGVSTIGIGPVFDARATKADAAAAMGTDGLSRIVASARDGLFPVAIGGITLANAGKVLEAGARGLAVVSALSKAEDPTAVARAFRKEMGE